MLSTLAGAAGSRFLTFADLPRSGTPGVHAAVASESLAAITVLSRGSAPWARASGWPSPHARSSLSIMHEPRGRVAPDELGAPSHPDAQPSVLVAVARGMKGGRQFWRARGLPMGPTGSAGWPTRRRCPTSPARSRLGGRGRGGAHRYAPGPHG